VNRGQVESLSTHATISRLYNPGRSAKAI